MIILINICGKNWKFREAELRATARQNRLISNKNVSFDFIEPFNFTSEILNRPARQRGEIQTQNSSKNSLNPIECPRQELNPQPLGSKPSALSS